MPSLSLGGSSKKDTVGTDSKYFASNKKGEIHELKAELNATGKDQVKEAIKKVIAAMTVGKDVSGLFADVIKSMQTDDVELKKLIYLYIINYARSQPEKAILVVNTFQRDAGDRSSALIRALAIRTMGCIRVEKITEYLCEPLSKALKDKDPYVRKTAAICTAKLYDINRELVEEQGFLDTLRNMIADPNPMVVANAVAALAEIAEASQTDVFKINSSMLGKLLAALNECTEWGQVFILDCLARYEPSSRDAKEIVERVCPRLKHRNSAVSMSAVKVIMKYMEFTKDEELEKKLMTTKLPPPLITLMAGGQPEIQYVALRNINVITQKRPQILSNAVKHFFCKFNDPIYVKMEKLEIMIQLSSNKNIDKVLAEFKEYATEVDVEFVRKSVLAIGRCAIKLDKAAERCIKVLLELIGTQINYVVQESVIVIKDIFRKYPNRYESIISTLCENLETLDSEEAKAAMIWIIGEYADRIENAPELLESFVETFQEEQGQVQLQLLTGVVKLFLKRPDDAKDMVTQVLNMATENTDNPDLRDRGYVYWRLLSTDPEAAQKVVLAKRPTVKDDTHTMHDELLDSLVCNISSLSSVYHKPPELLFKDGMAAVVLRPTRKSRRKDDSDSDSDSDSKSDSGSDSDSGSGSDSSEEEEKKEKKPKKKAPAKKKASKDVKAVAPKKAAPVASGDVMDLLNMGALSMEPASGGGGGGMDLFDIGMGAAPAAGPKLFMDSTKGKGLQVRGTFARRNGTPFVDFTFDNQSQQALTSVAMKFNNNYLGVTPASSIKINPVQPGGSTTFSLPLKGGGAINAKSVGIVQTAVKTNLGVSYFDCPVPAHIMFEEGGELEKTAFLQTWGGISDNDERSVQIGNRTCQSVEDIKNRLTQHNTFYIASRSVPQRGEVSYYSLSFSGTAMLVEITINGGDCSCCIKSTNPTLAESVLVGLQGLLT